jgi:hypothetical protein
MYLMLAKRVWETAKIVIANGSEFAQDDFQP